MDCFFVDGQAKRKSAGALIFPFFGEKEAVRAAVEIKTFFKTIAPVLEAKDFKAKEGEVLFLYPEKEREKRFLLLGLGEEKKVTKEVLRRALAAAVKACRKKKVERLNIFLPHTSSLSTREIADALCEGVMLANYSFDTFQAKEEKYPLIQSISLIGAGKEMAKMAQKNQIVVDCVNLARNLVNGNADDVTADTLVRTAQEIGKAFSSLKVEILRKKEIQKEEMGLLLAVNRASSIEPALIIIQYSGSPHSKECTAIVGKGITFDTGGLNLKQTGQIETMKCDMAGAATVLGTLQAIAALKLKVNVVGVIASTENAIGPESYKPGDVYKSLSGKSVEISNTDAEGRLVLADAISYVQKKFSLKRIIDLATLTGGILIALGEEATGLFSNADSLAHQLVEAGEKTFERLWRFPLYPEYREALRSTIADIKNSGGKKASSITAALFIKEFVKEGLDWAHLDIAGTAYLSEPKHYHTTPATGVGVRLLVNFFEHLK